MKKITALLFALVVVEKLQSQQLFTNEQLDAQQTVVKLFDALSNRDSLSLKANSTADLTLYEYGQVWNIDTLILKAITVNTAADFKRTNSFDFITTTTDKNSAWVTYRLNSAIIWDGKQATVQWLETVVLAREKKHWKVKHLHSTLLKRN